MSKANFSKNINDAIKNKLSALENIKPNYFFEKNEYFELALCLSYMTLSKEKIIKKEMKNNKRLDRITKRIDENEINKLFDPSFNNEIPIIINSKENDRSWILDNIRDSIMHGVFEVDEDKKCFIINNEQYDRELEAEIPFSWFIAYAKNDILKKKLLNKYTVKGFYSNKEKINKKHFNPIKELYQTILYNVNIDGPQFNVNDIENRVRDLFVEYSQIEVTDEDIINYSSIINDKYKKFFDEKYLVSFYKAKDKVIEEINKEYPNLNIRIIIDNRKHKIVNKASKRLPKYYSNYALLLDGLYSIISSKSTSLLFNLSNIIEGFDKIEKTDYSNYTQEENMKIFNSILNSNYSKYTDQKDIILLYKQNINTLRSICLNVLGLSTLVINHKELYDSYFLNQYPSYYNIFALYKKPYLEYKYKERALISELLDDNIKLTKKQDQYSKCPNEQGKTILESTIKSLEQEIENINQKLQHLSFDTGFERTFDSEIYHNKEYKDVNDKLSKYFEHFYKTKDIDAKIRIKKIILSLLDKKNEIEDPYVYGVCLNMEDALTIIRNAFSHIGRIFMMSNNGIHTKVILNDYDNDGSKSGIVITTYTDLINLISMPLSNQNVKKKTR